MAIQFNLKSGSGCGSQNSCLPKDGCPEGTCPDFTIKRHDTKPPFKVSVEDCEGPLDLEGLVVEANMWALGKLKSKITDSDDYFALADNIGFDQVMVGDIIVMDRVRMPEQMLVTAFDETNYLIKVQRGYHGTTPSAWKKGAALRIFRILNAPAEAELAFEDVEEIDGTVSENQLVGASLIYEWSPEDTCLPGCYWFEFKLLKMIDVVYYLPGGNWTGEMHQDGSGFFYTGSIHTDSSVRLSFDQIEDLYFLPDTVWPSETHLHSDSNNYTGPIHNDGSVILNQTGVPADSTTAYDDEGAVGLLDLSLISFTDESLSPYYFNCILGEGVEWVRRFPLTGEGFLIKIENSNTPG